MRASRLIVSASFGMRFGWVGVGLKKKQESWQEKWVLGVKKTTRIEREKTCVDGKKGDLEKKEALDVGDAFFFFFFFSQKINNPNTQLDRT